MAKRKTFPYLLTVIILILASTASWAFYSIINNGAKDLLALINIENLYLQGAIIIGAIFIVLVILGVGYKKSLKKILRLKK